MFLYVVPLGNSVNKIKIIAENNRGEVNDFCERINSFDVPLSPDNIFMKVVFCACQINFKRINILPF